MPVIRCSASNPEFFQSGFNTKYDWDCFAQCGGGERMGFFFEAFPDHGMIRADSKISMEDAEEKAWTRYKKLILCPLDHKDHSNLDRRHYENGCAFCKGCGQYIGNDYSGLPPTTTCVKCGVPTYYGTNNKEEWHCEGCLDSLPDCELKDYQLDKRHKKGVFAE